jgi:heptose I phosphotransferase
MWLDPRYQESLERAGMDGFDGVMNASQGRCLRVLRDRENWHLRLDDAEPKSLGMYLKKHRIRTWSTRVGATLGHAPGPSAGCVEAENLRCLAALGIEVPRLVACGERLSHDGRFESFLLTEELEGYCELQQFIEERFAPCGPGGRPDPRLHGVIRQVADIARRFHGAGYNHRDFYTCHFLIKETRPDRFDIRLIDLHRAERRRWFRRRWIVKDLAQLAVMVPGSHVRCREKILFLRHYLGVRKLRAEDKRLIRSILGKQWLIEWRERRRKG